MTARRALLALVLCGLLTAPVTTACSSGSSRRDRAPAAGRAKTTLDKAPSVHFILTSQTHLRRGRRWWGARATSPGRRRSRARSRCSRRARPST